MPLRFAKHFRFSAEKLSQLFWQVLVVIVVLYVMGSLWQTVSHNLAARNIKTGFDFLKQEASFDISEKFLVSFSAKDSFAKAFWVGILNTIKVSAIGIFFSIILGTLLAFAKVSQHLLLKKMASAYIEFIRNIPLLIQLFFWYTLITESLPLARNALQPLPGVFLCNRGLFIPTYTIMNTELGSHWGWVTPKLVGFNFIGGAHLTPEFTALLLALILYTTAFVAETVRAGIQSIPKGQNDACIALGLTRLQSLRFVILPQALRVIIPPLTSQMLNLTKNSSLALAIGYPDVVGIANITINQTGQAIEGVVLIMAVYLTLSLLTSFLMNLYNKRIQFVS